MIGYAILHEALKQVPAEELAAALIAQRSGAYLRRAAFLWEKANDRALTLPWSSAGGNYVGLFDPATYYTGPVWERSSKYRVNFNGIGPWAFCPTVARDEALTARGQAVLDRLRAWAADPGHQALVDRVMGWAYLAESRDSWAIEHETPSPDKEKAFLQAMAHLRDRQPVSEDYLVVLRDAVITNPWRVDVQYVPPPPDALPDLMTGWMRMANATEGDVPPLVKAALVSFGFVFLHPFMDGNGRLSRLLAHHSLNLQQALPSVGRNPAILPLSVAMKRHEADYLAALEAFSKPARALWDVADAGIRDVFRHLANDPERTGFIAAEVRQAFEDGRKVLVLTERTDHLDAIRTAVDMQVSTLFVLHGRMSKAQRAALVAEMDALPPDAPRVLLATGKLVGEGFDHPPLDTLVLAMPVSWKGTLQQYAGRLHREQASKRDVRIVDIVDAGHPALLRMWDKRQRGTLDQTRHLAGGLPRGRPLGYTAVGGSPERLATRIRSDHAWAASPPTVTDTGTGTKRRRTWPRR